MAQTDERISTMAQWLKGSQAAVAFTGAGISTPSGIPDFRSTESGLWQDVDPMRVASIYGFRQNPQAFYNWVRPLAKTTMNAKPNPAHLALARLEQIGKLKAVITQNIDMLHSRAGTATLYEIHGDIREATCIHCFEVYDGLAILDSVMANGCVPRCPQCGGVLKPNVILFGEQLPHEAFNAAKQAARNSDLMLVVGSSLEVAPASDIPALAQRNGAKLVIVNQESTMMDSSADLVIQGNAAQILPAILQTLETLL